MTAMLELAPAAPIIRDDAFAAWLSATPTAWGSDASGLAWQTIADVGDFEHIAIFCEAPRPIALVQNLVLYALSGEGGFGGEVMAGPVVDARDGFGQIFIFWADSTKCQRDDLGDALDVLVRTLADGTPVRKTDRAGAGTRGTRKWDALGTDFAIAFR